MTSAMPTGGVDSPSGGQASPAGGQGADNSAPASAGWMPVCRMGQGTPGVFTDAQGLIAGEPATITAQSVADAGDAAAAAASAPAVGQDGGVGPLDVGAPPAGSMPTGGSQ